MPCKLCRKTDMFNYLCYIVLYSANLYNFTLIFFIDLFKQIKLTVSLACIVNKPLVKFDVKNFKCLNKIQFVCVSEICVQHSKYCTPMTILKI